MGFSVKPLLRCSSLFILSEENSHMISGLFAESSRIEYPDGLLESFAVRIKEKNR